jgi:oligopeptidase B
MFATSLAYNRLMTSLYRHDATVESTRIHPPVALCKPVIREIHGDRYVDQYEWMRDKNSSETKAYITKQNEYAKKRLAPLEKLKTTLFNELKSRVLETDMSVPTRVHGYWYYTRIRKGDQYAIQCRMPVTDTNDWVPPEVDGQAELGSTPGEEVFFDSNVESKNYDFYRLGGLDISADGRWLLYCCDTQGDERYDIRLRDLVTGCDTSDCIDQVSSGPVLTPDGRWIFYTKVDQAWRPCAVWRHKVGTPVSEDQCVFEETDERFWIGVSLSFDERSVLISASSKTTSEVQFLSLSNPEGSFKPFIKRQEGIEYDVSFASLPCSGTIEGNSSFPVGVVYQNLDNPNFAIRLIDMRIHEAPFSLDDGVIVVQGSPYGCEQTKETSNSEIDKPYFWEGNPEILQGVKGLSIEGMGIYQNFALLSYRADSLVHLAVISSDQAAQDFKEGIPWHFREIKPAMGGMNKIYTVSSADNPSYEAPTVRYSYDSYTCPPELHELDVATGIDRLLKRAQVLGDFNSDQYSECRLCVKVRDGVSVPVSLVWRKDLVPVLTDNCTEGLSKTILDSPEDLSHLEYVSNGDTSDTLHEHSSAPCFITGYGAYEIPSDSGFSTGRLSLLDRGVVYASVHVRGGGEMGRAWYEQGRRLNKKHTFEDFVDVTGALEQAGWIDARRTVANGGSAGGLLMGAIANIAPQLYAGIEADVPFVDALNTMLNPTLPLTVTEWDEWGDPLHDAEVYRYMKDYTPYENVLSQQERMDLFGDAHFPKMFITTSLNDTRVLCVEPLKWAARLQEASVAADAIIKIEVDAGHAGTSGRYRQWEDLALENAYCLSILTPDDPDLRAVEV